MVDYSKIIEELNPDHDELLDAELLNGISNTDVSNLSYGEVKNKLMIIKQEFIKGEMAYSADQNDLDMAMDTDMSNCDLLRDSFRQYLKEISSYSLLTPEEEKRLFTEYRDGNKKLFDKLVNCNLRLVVSVAKRYSIDTTEIMDLISEGNLGLMKAVKKYDPSKGFRFSTYAYYWIRQAITISLSSNLDQIIIPQHALTDATSKKKEILKKQEELGRKLTANETRKLFDSEKDYNRFTCIQDAKNIVGLESKIADDDESELGDFIADENAIKPEENAVTHNSYELIMQAINECLTENEKEVILKWFGFGEYEGYNYTFEDIGREKNLSKQRIDQMEKAALKRLRRSGKIKKLGDEYGLCW